MRNRGFTLLEMMVVIIIIGTIAAIAVPRMNDIFEVNLKSSIRRMIGMIQFAFNESVIKQTPLRLNFSPETGEYWLSAMLSSGDTGQFVEYVTDVVKPQQLPEGVLINDVVTPHDSEKRTDGDDIFIGFFPTGFVERGVIHLSSRDGRQFTLVIEPNVQVNASASGARAKSGRSARNERTVYFFMGSSRFPWERRSAPFRG